MRVAKTDIIAGLPAPVARSLARLFRGFEFVQEVGDSLLLKNGIDNTDAVFAALEERCYFEKVEVDREGYVWWQTTTLGNALAMASFGKPISRRTAERLIAGMLDRAREYNADPARPLYVERLRIFGSYLNPAIDLLGDVDVELSIGQRIRDQEKIRAYTRSSGRTFRSVWAEVTWPQTELVQRLKNKSTALNITLENIDHITDQSQVVYAIDDDPGAAPPPDMPSQRL
jgi:hypothetical protein